MLVLPDTMPLGIPFPLSLMPDRSAPARTSTSKRTTLRRFYSTSPFPHMHYCTFVIIGPQGDPDALVAGALAPFDEALTVTPYREYRRQPPHASPVSTFVWVA
jgi:hypothetical protein